MPPPAFDVSAVSQHVIEECKKPIVFDSDVCTYVAIDVMSDNSTTLFVPTTLKSGTDETYSRAEAICNALAHSHVDADGNDLGYKTVDVEDREGYNVADCVVAQ